MREMAATGDLTRRIAAAAGDPWEDEDARLLATTFNAMTDSIARFQREAAQRERLSSLGRLSTVVAHEIRNPLMIIKTALRDAARREAAAAERPGGRRRHRRRGRPAQPDRLGRPRLRPADQVRAGARRPQRALRRRRTRGWRRATAAAAVSTWTSTRPGGGHDRRRTAAARAGEHPDQRPARRQPRGLPAAGTRSA